MFKDSACCISVGVCIWVCVCGGVLYLSCYVCNICLVTFYLQIFVCTFVFVFVHVCNVCMSVCACVLYASMYRFACNCIWLHLVEDVVKLSVIADLVKGLPQLIWWNIWNIGTISKDPIYGVIPRCNSFIADRINNFL